MEEEKTVGLVETFDTGELSTELIPPNFTDPDDLFEILKKTVSSYHPSNDLEMINKAYELAKDAHKDQKRKSGEPYLIHPVCVAIILAQLEMDKETIAAGILHDVVGTDLLGIDCRNLPEYYPWQSRSYCSSFPMDFQLYHILYIPGTVRLQSDVRIQFVWHHLCCSCLLCLALGTRNEGQDSGRYE